MTDMNTPVSASTGSENPYLSDSGAGQQSPFMSQVDVNPFGQQSAQDPQYAQSQPMNGNNQFSTEQQAQLPQQQSEGASVGDVLQAIDGTSIQYTPELQNTLGELHGAVESQLGAGTAQQLIEFGNTLPQNVQASLERMVLSGDKAQMQRAVDYVREQMQQRGGSYVPAQQGGWNTPQAQGYQHPQQQGISQAEFHAGLSALERSGFGPGHRQYDDQYRNLVQQYSLGRRSGR
ncbi:hypothetical protein ACVFDQ_002757 [Enterobacter hormaechei]